MVTLISKYLIIQNILSKFTKNLSKEKKFYQCVGNTLHRLIAKAIDIVKFLT